MLSLAPSSTLIRIQDARHKDIVRLLDVGDGRIVEADAAACSRRDVTGQQHAQGRASIFGVGDRRSAAVEEFRQRGREAGDAMAVGGKVARMRAQSRAREDVSNAFTDEERDQMK